MRLFKLTWTLLFQKKRKTHKKQNKCLNIELKY